MKMKKFFVWLFELPGYPPPGPATVAHVVARPPEINPTTAHEEEFSEWRAAHIARWLADPDNATHTSREYLTEERDMHLAALRRCGKEV
jgi:hypothetical protein